MLQALAIQPLKRLNSSVVMIRPT